MKAKCDAKIKKEQMAKKAAEAKLRRDEQLKAKNEAIKLQREEK